MKGIVLLKNHAYGRWIHIFETWYESEFLALVIHCDSKEQLKTVSRSAMNWRSRNGNPFWIHTADHRTLCLVKSEAIKQVAMEVVSNEKGVYFTYDTSETV